MTDIAKDNYKDFLKEVLNKINHARIDAVNAINKSMVGLYFNIGKLIVEKQEQYGWGKSVVEQLSKDLNKLYDGVTGYSAQNLWYMRQFLQNIRILWI